VEVVDSGRKALEILFTPDNGVQLVLCDLHMPDGNALKFFPHCNKFLFNSSFVTQLMALGL